MKTDEVGYYPMSLNEKYIFSMTSIMVKKINRNDLKYIGWIEDSIDKYKIGDYYMYYDCGEHIGGNDAIRQYDSIGIIIGRHSPSLEFNNGKEVLFKGYIKKLDELWSMMNRIGIENEYIKENISKVYKTNINKDFALGLDIAKIISERTSGEQSCIVDIDEENRFLSNIDIESLGWEIDNVEFKGRNNTIDYYRLVNKSHIYSKSCYYQLSYDNKGLLSIMKYDEFDNLLLENIVGQIMIKTKKELFYLMIALNIKRHE